MISNQNNISFQTKIIFHFKPKNISFQMQKFSIFQTPKNTSFKTKNISFQKFFVLFTFYIGIMSYHSLFLGINHFINCIHGDWKTCTAYSPPATVVFILFLLFEVGIGFSHSFLPYFLGGCSILILHDQMMINPTNIPLQPDLYDHKPEISMALWIWSIWCIFWFIPIWSTMNSAILYQYYFYFVVILHIWQLFHVKILEWIWFCCWFRFLGRFQMPLTLHRV